MRMIKIYVLLTLVTSLGWGQVVYWEPEQPWQGGDVSIYYDVIEGNLPNNASDVYIHLGYNGWTNVNDFPMTYTGTDGWWQFDWTIPEGVSVIDIVFFEDVNHNGEGDGNDIWDNNGGVGIDWHIPVIEADLWTPLVPNPNDTVTIYVNNSVGGNLWWGVNGWHEPLQSFWPPGTVVGDPGASVESPLNGPDENGDNWIQVGPFTSGQQPVEVLDFVFHWNDGTWDNNGGNDYHIFFDFTPQEGDATIEIISHEDEDVVGGTETIVFTTSGSVYNEVWIDDNLFYVSGGDGTQSFDWETDDIDFGRHTFWYRAENSDDRVTFKKLVLWKTPNVVHAPVPEGTELGVADNGDGTVTFALLAPDLPFVNLLADWESWDSNALVMNYDDGAGIWWLVDTLASGTYEYMYLLHGERQLGDPYATDVYWKLSGQEDWHVENQKCRFTVGADPFPWTDQEWQQPVMEDLIIYEMVVRDFTPQKDFDGLIEKLDYLQELGINAIELMPVWEFPGGSSWGYNPTFFFAVESSYGTPDDFKTVVDEAHARGIAVIMDVVFNHCDGTSPYYQLYREDYAHSPYIHAEQNPWGMPDFDHGKDGTRQLVKDVVRYWMEEYHVDGFRYDNTTGFGWSGESDYGISLFSYEAWQVNPDVYQIAEHFSDFNDLYNLMSTTKINSHWHDIFHDQMKANLREGQFEGSWYGDMVATAEGVSYAYHGFDEPRNVTNYTESHDEQRIIWEAQTNGTIDYELAVEKSKLGGAVLLTSAGVPMMYHGQEMGMDTERTLDYNPVQWSLLDTPVGEELYSHYSRLLWLRNTYEALRSFNCSFSFFGNSKTLAYTRSGSNGTLVIVANFARNDDTVDLSFPHGGDWYEFLQDDTLAVEGSSSTVTVPGSGALIFSDNKLWENVGVHDESNLPLEFSLGQNHPNPFNAATRITFSLPEDGDVSLIIYDLLGRRVRELATGKWLTGVYQMQWDGKDDLGQPVSSGVYLYSLQTSSHSATKKLLLLK